MTATDRLTDTTGVQVGDPDPWTGDYDMCDARLESDRHFICTAPRGHTGPHVAAGGSDIVGVDPSITDDTRAETATATTEEWAHRLESGGATIWPTREQAEADRDAYLNRPRDPFEPPPSASIGIWRREVTDWQQVDQ